MSCVRQKGRLFRHTTMLEHSLQQTVANSVSVCAICDIIYKPYVQFCCLPIFATITEQVSVNFNNLVTVTVLAFHPRINFSMLQVTFSLLLKIHSLMHEMVLERWNDTLQLYHYSHAGFCKLCFLFQWGGSNMFKQKFVGEFCSVNHSVCRHFPSVCYFQCS